MTLTVDTVLDHVTTVRVLLASGQGREAYNACGALLNAASDSAVPVREAALDYTLLVAAVADGRELVQELNRSELVLIGELVLLRDGVSR